MALKLDLGGIGKDGEWTTINLDNSGFRAPPDIVADITSEAGQLDQYFKPGTVDSMRCIHTLEHLPQWEIQLSLTYWRKFLKPGGDLLIVVPNIGMMALDYCAGVIPFDVLAAVAYVTGWRTRHGAGEEHRWGWCYDTLVRDLMAAGYRDPVEALDYPGSWIFDYDDMKHTDCVWKYQVPNLRVRAWA